MNGVIIINKFKSIQEVLKKYNINVSMDDSIKGFINKLSYNLSNIEDDVVKSKAIEDISQVLSNWGYLSRKSIM